MLSNQVNGYLESLISKRDIHLEEIERYAMENNVPIMELVGIEALLQLLRLYKPKRILEIGTAIGYSAIRMAQALPSTKIVTIERDKERFDQALHFIGETNTSNQIDALFGDALELVDVIHQKGPFDCIFIDAAKGQYQRFFDSYQGILNESGVIITDNVLFKGLVANQDEIESKRIRSLVKKIKSYNEWLMNHPNFITTIVPVGDGIAISLKRGVKE